MAWSFSPTADECIAAGVAAVIGTIAATIAGRSDVGRLEFRIKWLAAARWWIRDVPVDTWRLVRAVLRRKTRSARAASSERSLPFDPGGDDARSVMRRALALTITSIAPNTIGIDVDRRHGRFVYHEVVARRAPDPARELSHSS